MPRLIATCLFLLTVVSVGDAIAQTTDETQTEMEVEALLRVHLGTKGVLASEVVTLPGSDLLIVRTERQVPGAHVRVQRGALFVFSDTVLAVTSANELSGVVAKLGLHGDGDVHERAARWVRLILASGIIGSDVRLVEGPSDLEGTPRMLLSDSLAFEKIKAPSTERRLDGSQFTFFLWTGEVLYRFEIRYKDGDESPIVDLHYVAGYTH